MSETDYYRYIKCERCDARSILNTKYEVIENSYCDCGGKQNFISESEYSPNSSKIEIEELVKEYNEKYERYLELEKILKTEISMFLYNNVEKFRIESRIKSLSNFIEKNEIKNYTKPFDEIEDICGLRIICYYASDMLIISKIIKKEFEIIKVVDKSDNLLNDAFGYRSLHFIIKIKNKKLIKSNKDIKDLKAEIQVRTILMDAHASIEHQLTYKKNIYVPINIQRSLAKLSAALEILDEQFVNVKEELNKYNEEIQDFLLETDFDISKELNLETLQELMDYIFPEREKIDVKTEELYEQIKGYNENNTDQITLNTLLNAYAIVKNDLENIERKHFAFRENEFKWHQSECLSHILDLGYPWFSYYYSA